MRLTTASLSHSISGHTLIFLLGIPAPYCRLDAEVDVSGQWSSHAHGWRTVTKRNSARDLRLRHILGADPISPNDRLRPYFRHSKCRSML
jgi:hypothetical protein